MNKDELKALIRSKVYANNNNEITGAGLQEVLLAMVDNIGKEENTVVEN